MDSLLSSAQVIKVIRTFAQAVGGLVVVFVADWLGVELDAGSVEAVLYPIAVGFWVLLVDLLVRYVHPGFEMLNVISKTPSYGPAVEAPAEPAEA